MMRLHPKTIEEKIRQILYVDGGSRDEKLDLALCNVAAAPKVDKGHKATSVKIVFSNAMQSNKYLPYNVQRAADGQGANRMGAGRAQGRLPFHQQRQQSIQPKISGRHASGANQGAIDNRIEQAMDLVKSHLMNAVRSEVEEMREKIIKLEEKISTLQSENDLLKANVTNDVLLQISSVSSSNQAVATSVGAQATPPSSASFVFTSLSSSAAAVAAPPPPPQSSSAQLPATTPATSSVAPNPQPSPPSHPPAVI